jgi:glycosyltransferase involved in cell wall biosynthesis
MRVLHLVSGDLWAGAEVATYHLLVQLARSSSVCVSALLLNDGELAQRLRCHEEIVTTIEDESQQSFPSLARNVRRHCQGADLVHAHRYKENLLAALSGRPWLSTQHGRPEPTEGWRDGVQRKLIHEIDQGVKRYSAKRVIAVATEVQEWLQGHARQRRTVLVPNGIPDVAAEQPGRPWADRPRRLGVLARLFPVKGLALAIDAVAACDSGVEFEILGDGPEREALEQRVRERGCEGRVRFLGHLSNPLPHVAEWRALLVTSLHEGNPISVLEALALGTPVISCSLRGIDEILAGEGGLLIPHREPEGWARSIESILDNDAIGSEMSLRARRRFEAAWSVDVAADAMLRVYREIVDEGSHSAAS